MQNAHTKKPVCKHSRETLTRQTPHPSIHPSIIKKVIRQEKKIQFRTVCKELMEQKKTKTIAIVKVHVSEKK